MEVVQVLPPRVARTRNDPKPRVRPAVRSRISAEASAGRLRKVQLSARRALHSHSGASKSMTTCVSITQGTDSRLARRQAHDCLKSDGERCHCPGAGVASYP